MKERMRIVVVDTETTETTGTDPQIHEVWEIATLRLSHSLEPMHQPQVTLVQVQDLALADPRALEIGGYWERGGPSRVVNEIERTLRGARLASCNVAFDSTFLRRLLSDHNLPVGWHYSPIDIKSVCYGKRPDLLGAKTDELIEAFLDESDLAKCDAFAATSLRHSAIYDCVVAAALLRKALAL